MEQIAAVNVRHSGGGSSGTLALTRRCFIIVIMTNVADNAPLLLLAW
jgi:hypothetical protein